MNALVLQHPLYRIEHTDQAFRIVFADGIQPPKNIARKAAGRLGQYRLNYGRSDLVRRTSFYQNAIAFELCTPINKASDEELGATLSAIEYVLSPNQFSPLFELTWLTAHFSSDPSPVRDALVEKRLQRIFSMLNRSGWKISHSAVRVLITGITESERSSHEFEAAMSAP